ncbi:2436_t:CDS:2, partial [Acaulospora colombiana]
LSEIFDVEEYKIRYTDTEGDKIVIENDPDLKEAINYFSNNCANGRFTVKLCLEKAIKTAPQSSSAPSSDNDNDEQYYQEEFPFEKVINTSIKTVQEMVNNFVNQLSTAIERDLSNLNLSGSRQPQQTTNDNNEGSNSKDSTRVSSFQSSTETRQAPKSESSDVAFHPGIRCDGCGKPINGVRFKCGNCADFDLCGNCEASPATKHNPDHVFIKFRRPVPSPLSASEPLLRNFYSRSEFGVHQTRRRQSSSQQKLDNKEVEKPQVSKKFVNTEPSADLPVTSRAPVDLYTFSGVSNISTPSLVRNLEPQIQIHTYVPASSIPASPPANFITSQSTTIDEIKPEPETKREVKVEPTLDALFVEDVNIPDGTVLEPQTQFRKIWRMVNNGNVNWPESTTLQHIGGPPMASISESGKFEFKVGSLEVGKSSGVAADLRAPSEPGRYTSRWCLTDGQGNSFGHHVWCDIIVENDEQSSNMSSSSMIFPVLNYDQKPKFVQPNSVSEQLSSISNSVAFSEVNQLQNEEDPFQDSISPDLAVTEFVRNQAEVENNSELCDSDEESDTSSIAYSEDSSQDFVVVDKDSDDEMELSQSQHSLLDPQTPNEDLHVTRSEVISFSLHKV